MGGGLVSSEPLSIGDDGAEPLYLGWYGGPARSDGGIRARVSLVRDGMEINLSVEELKRLVHTAGVFQFVPSPYAVPEAEKHDEECTCTEVCAPWRKPRDHIVNETPYGVGRIA
jgi:hypothetical protein